MTDLSIIIVSYKGWARLTKCLEALNSFTGKAYTAEVIVVDNKSDDKTIFKIEKQFPEFRFIFNNLNGGFANGCNLGARNSNGEFLLFLNPDTVAIESEIEKLLNNAKHNSDNAIHSCRQVNEKGKENITFGQFPCFLNITGFQRSVAKLFKSLTNSEDYDKDIIHYPDWISGSVFLLKRKVFQKLNGFDEDFWMYFEDVDLCRRANKTGIKIMYYNYITIEHDHGGSSRINIITTVTTKTEVYISRHVYINIHKRGFERFLTQSFLVINNIISGLVMALIGLLFFFIPKLFLRTLIFLRLIKYYYLSLLRQSWISNQSVNFPERHVG